LLERAVVADPKLADPARAPLWFALDEAERSALVARVLERTARLSTIRGPISKPAFTAAVTSELRVASAAREQPCRFDEQPCGFDEVAHVALRWAEIVETFWEHLPAELAPHARLLQARGGIGVGLRHETNWAEEWLLIWPLFTQPLRAMGHEACGSICGRLLARVSKSEGRRALAFTRAVEAYVARGVNEETEAPRAKKARRS
jgi:hypothetical protein